jgi:flagellar FliL protein
MRMTDATDISPDDVPATGGRKGKGLLLGLLGALVLGGGGFYAVFSGLVPSGHGEVASREHAVDASLADIAFVPMEPIMISLAPGASAKHLRFSGQLEVTPGHAEDVTQVMPRVLDVLNTYLRAVDVRDLEQPSAIPKLRAQMLRRVQVVTGDGLVRDLLITEFVLN